MKTETVTAKGITGKINFDGHTITITRSGALARSISGNGTTTVPLGQVTGVDFKPTGAMRGHITILTAGTVATRRRGVHKFSDDPLTVEFMRHSGNFQQVRDAIQAAISNHTATTPERPTFTEQISTLATLHERGLLSNAEYTTAKTRLLSP